SESRIFCNGIHFNDGTVIGNRVAPDKGYLKQIAITRNSSKGIRIEPVGCQTLINTMARNLGGIPITRIVQWNTGIRVVIARRKIRETELNWCSWPVGRGACCAICNESRRIQNPRIYPAYLCSCHPCSSGDYSVFMDVHSSGWRWLRRLSNRCAGHCRRLKRGIPMSTKYEFPRRAWWVHLWVCSEGMYVCIDRVPPDVMPRLESLIVGRFTHSGKVERVNWNHIGQGTFVEEIPSRSRPYSKRLRQGTICQPRSEQIEFVRSPCSGIVQN